MEYRDISVERLDHEEHPHVLLITLDRPDKRNPLGLTTVTELCHALEAATGYSDRLLHGEDLAEAAE